MKCIAITLCSNANLDVWSTLQQWPYQSQSQATTQQIWVSRVCVARVRSQLESPLLWCQIKRLIDEHWGVLSAIMKHHFTQHLIKQYMDIIYGHHLLFYDATALLHTSGSWLSCWSSTETPSWVFLHCAVLLASPAVKLWWNVMADPMVASFQYSLMVCFTQLLLAMRQATAHPPSYSTCHPFD